MQCYIFNSNVNVLVTTATTTVAIMCEFRWNDNEVDVGILCVQSEKGGRKTGWWWFCMMLKEIFINTTKFVKRINYLIFKTQVF